MGVEKEVKRREGEAKGCPAKMAERKRKQNGRRKCKEERDKENKREKNEGGIGDKGERR